VLDEVRIAHEWRVPVRRTSRSPEHPEIAQLREDVLNALGVAHTTTHHHDHETGAA
jgi:hypothetical protein